MKSYEEMSNDVFHRIAEYNTARKKKRKMIAGIAASACCVCLISVIGIAAWNGERNAATPPATLDDSVIIGEQDYFDDANKGGTSGIPAEGSKQVFHVISLAKDGAGEFAADMYRPEGFNVHIGSALALKMRITEDADQKFPVLVSISGKISHEEAVKKTNSVLDDPINIDEALPVYFADDLGSAENKFYYLLTANQITALADNGAMCFYIGSGEGVYDDINWDTNEGISTFCELYGDMYVAGEGNITYSPDIYVN